MTARKRIIIADTMQASCRALRIPCTLLITTAIFLGFWQPSAHAAPQYETGYSPAAQAELDAARQRRKEIARQRINNIIKREEPPPPDLSPKTLLSSPPAAKPVSSSPHYIPPAPAPVTPQYRAPVPPAAYMPTQSHAAPTPVTIPSTPPAAAPQPVAPPPQPSIIQEMLQSQPIPEPIVSPRPLPLEPQDLTPQTVQTPPSSDLPPMPWHQSTAEQEAPDLSQTAPDLIMPPPPEGTVQQGLVSDKTYIVGPGAPPPPPSPPLDAPISHSGSEAAMLPEVGEAIEASAQKHAETLSPETEEILDSLPEDIIGRPLRKDTPGEFTVERIDPAIALPDLGKDSPEVSSESLGMKVAIKKRPIDVNYELEKAYVSLTGGNTEEAIAIYKTVLEIAPENEQALFGLATTYHRVGLLDEARPIYGKLLKINPRNKDAINNFLVMVGEEAPERALEHMKHLEMENPEFAPIPAQMALLYTKIGDMPAAIKSMQKAVSLSPENLIYKYNLAILFDQANKPVEASILYKQLLEARFRGEPLPADADEIQQRLTFLLSNK